MWRQFESLMSRFLNGNLFKYWNVYCWQVLFYLFCMKHFVLWNLKTHYMLRHACVYDSLEGAPFTCQAGRLDINEFNNTFSTVFLKIFYCKIESWMRDACVLALWIKFGMLKRELIGKRISYIIYQDIPSENLMSRKKEKKQRQTFSNFNHQLKKSSDRETEGSMSIESYRISIYYFTTQQKVVPVSDTLPIPLKISYIYAFPISSVDQNIFNLSLW